MTKQPFATLNPIWMPHFNFYGLGAGDQDLLNIISLLLPGDSSTYTRAPF